ncbi:MAG: D-alanine--D-alanine ligase [Kineosporiaceae bacterium]|nr:D-alanine--D-alanine ligase [Kineosporiaceae bacterium]MBK7625400.1 D-alanine--D-alanine ligase [Kineosporiaceae bacterium]MBK8076237.1 D-alanine--D-alanine ligase [Kineosporiaceae bacterium]
MSETVGPEGLAQSARRPRVAVVFGGRSSEHGISCVTAAGVMQAIDPTRWDVVPIGITPTGRWVLAGEDPKRWQIEAGVLPEVGADEGPAVLVPLESGVGTLTVLEPDQVPRTLSQVDVVFPLLHGPFGEDGTLQGLLELADIRYVGSGVLASAASMDKHYMKVLLDGAGLPVGPYTVVRPRDWERHPDRVREDVEELGYPVFVKPARAGSSIGISKVSSAEDLDAAIETAREHDPKVIIEAMIVGREIECAVLESADGGAPATSLPGEIRVVGGHDFYDFEAKYLDEASVQLSCPADLPDHVVRQVRDLAGRAFEAMGCEGLARVDFFVTPDDSVVVNEINTMPGFTPFSMYPRMWEQTGLSYPDLIDRLLTLAMRRRIGLR